MTGFRLAQHICIIPPPARNDLEAFRYCREPAALARGLIGKIAHRVVGQVAKVAAIGFDKQFTRQIVAVLPGQHRKHKPQVLHQEAFTAWGQARQRFPGDPLDHRQLLVVQPLGQALQVQVCDQARQRCRLSVAVHFGPLSEGLW